MPWHPRHVGSIAVLAGVAILAGTAALLVATPLAAQAPTVGTIDLYGLRTVSADSVRAAITFNVGDPQPSRTQVAATRRRLKEIPGVLAVDVALPCCNDGKLWAYVGIAEDSSAILAVHPRPLGDARLPAEIYALDGELSLAMLAAARAGNLGDDFSQGHSLMADSAVRAVQERFSPVAAQRLDMLRVVLRESANPDHRAFAAVLIGYAADKREVIDDLLHASHDPNEGVRNNATRALFAIAYFSRLHPELGIRIPAPPFVDMLGSVSWSDRNKGTAVLQMLTEGRDQELLTILREEALDPLVEMARWQGQHGWFAAFLLGRVAGLPEEELQEAQERDDRDGIVERALAAIPGGAGR